MRKLPAPKRKRQPTTSTLGSWRMKDPTARETKRLVEQLPQIEHIGPEIEKVLTTLGIEGVDAFVLVLVSKRREATAPHIQKTPKRNVATRGQRPHRRS